MSDQNRPAGTGITAQFWTLAHLGYSGNRRLDVWLYRTEAEALAAGARLAMECGMDDDRRTVQLYASGNFVAVMSRYEQVMGRGSFFVSSRRSTRPGAVHRLRRPSCVAPF